MSHRAARHRSPVAAPRAAAGPAAATACESRVDRRAMAAHTPAAATAAAPAWTSQSRPSPHGGRDALGRTDGVRLARPAQPLRLLAHGLSPLAALAQSRPVDADPGRARSPRRTVSRCLSVAVVLTEGHMASLLGQTATSGSQRSMVIGLGGSRWRALSPNSHFLRLTVGHMASPLDLMALSGSLRSAARARGMATESGASHRPEPSPSSRYRLPTALPKG